MPTESSATSSDGGVPALERKLIELIEADVKNRTHPSVSYRCSKELRDAMLGVLVDVFLAGTKAGPIPGYGDQSYAAQTGQEPREDP